MGRIVEQEMEAIEFLRKMGREVQSERTAQGMYQIELGERAGFTRLYISQIENTYRYKYHTNIYFKLAIALNIPLSVLVYRAMAQDSQMTLDTFETEGYNYPLEFDDITKVINYYSKKLKDERIARGIPRWKMAKQLNVVKETLEDTEHNYILTPFTRYYEYAKVFDFKLYDLIKEAEDFVINNKSK